MKRLSILTLLIIVGTLLFAQEDPDTDPGNSFRTIFSRDDQLFISGFGGPLMTFGSIDNEFAHMMGGGGGIQVNNLFFGGYGVGLTTPIEYKKDEIQTHNYSTNLEFGHGGLWVGIIIARKKPIHLSLSSQFGWGNIQERLDSEYGLDPITSEEVFVITPIVELEMNFSHFFKVGIGASTNILRGRGITLTPYTQSDFMNPSMFVSFKFGWFN